MRDLPCGLSNTLGILMSDSRDGVPEEIYDHLRNKTSDNIFARDGGSQFTKLNTLNHFHEAERAVRNREFDVFDIKFKARFDTQTAGNILSYWSDQIPYNRMGPLNDGERILIWSKQKNETFYLGSYLAVARRVIFKPKMTTFQKFHVMDLNLKYDLFVLPDRTTFKRERDALEKVKSTRYLRKLLVPKERNLSAIHRNERIQNIELFNRNIEKYQMGSIRSILGEACKLLPYILFGPPGTGKTTVIIETVLQIYVRKAGCRVLICSQSNDCADRIYDRLYGAKKIRYRDLIRISSKYHLGLARGSKNLFDDVESLGESLKTILMNLRGPETDEMMVQNSTPIVDGQVRYDAKSVNSRVKKIQIIVSTCSHAATFEGLKFDYVLIDEAGQLTEPEAAIPLSLLKPTGLLVLCGDPKQIGPVIMSKVAQEHGLGISWLDRLYKEIPNYKTFDPRCISQLKINHRSDERIFRVSNEKFYENSIQCKFKTSEDKLAKLNLKYPCVFCPIEGYGAQPIGDRSWFNLEEAKWARLLFEHLMSKGYQDISILSPFKLQVDYLKKEFKKRFHRYKIPKISTVNKFQGGESGVIILSVAKTKAGYILSDEKLSDEKLFNVAITRARSLIFVLGSEHYLTKIGLWKDWISQADRLDLESLVAGAL